MKKFIIVFAMMACMSSVFAWSFPWQQTDDQQETVTMTKAEITQLVNEAVEKAAKPTEVKQDKFGEFSKSIIIFVAIVAACYLFFGLLKTFFQECIKTHAFKRRLDYEYKLKQQLIKK